MRKLSDRGQQAVNDLARQHGFSSDAVSSLLQAMARGGGGMAQFAHPEFGGAGQWMSGMTMIADMFNDELKSRIDRLCVSLAQLLANASNFAAPDSEVRDSNGPELQGKAPGFTPRAEQGFAVSENPAASPDHARSGQWWPPQLGTASSTGSQNNLRYAYFAQARRLVIERDGKTTVYDTGDHQIGGVSQQQPSDSSLSFTSQHGPVDVTRLPIV